MKGGEEEKEILKTRVFIQNDQIINEIIVLEFGENKNKTHKQ